MKKVRMGCSVPPEVVEFIKIECERLGISRSLYLTNLINEQRFKMESLGTLNRLMNEMEKINIEKQKEGK